MIHPHMRFYIAKNPEYGQPIKPVAVPTREDFEIIRQYAPTQTHPNYEYWAEDMVERITQSRELHAKSVHTIEKAAIVTEEDIVRTEQLENFIKWIGLTE